jgi:L-rhamnose mutarotase
LKGGEKAVQRICFRMQVDPSRIDEYRARHVAVWPDMLREIAASGRRNYSLFDAGDGVIIGYFETDDLAASTDYLAHSTVAARWEADMQPFFTTIDTRTDQSLTPFAEVFNLADQLRAADAAPKGNPS